MAPKREGNENQTNDGSNRERGQSSEEGEGAVPNPSPSPVAANISAVESNQRNSQIGLVSNGAIRAETSTQDINGEVSSSGNMEAQRSATSDEKLAVATQETTGLPTTKTPQPKDGAIPLGGKNFNAEEELLAASKRPAVELAFRRTVQPVHFTQEYLQETPQGRTEGLAQPRNNPTTAHPGQSRTTNTSSSAPENPTIDESHASARSDAARSVEVSTEFLATTKQTAVNIALWSSATGLDGYYDKNAKVDRPDFVVNEQPQATPQPAPPADLRPGAYGRVPGGNEERRRTFCREQLNTDTEITPVLDPEALNRIEEEEEPQQTQVTTVMTTEMNTATTSGLVEARPVSLEFRRTFLNVAAPADLDAMEQRQVKKRRFNKVLFGCLGLAVLVVIVLATVLTRMNHNQNTSNGSTPPTLAPTPTPTPFLIAGLPNYTIEAILADANATSPQARAYEWLIHDPNFPIYTTDRQLQRFAMAVFYYSTGGENWTVANMWALNKTQSLNKTRSSPWLDYHNHECLWKQFRTWGKPCDMEQGDSLLYLNLNKNKLTGSLPRELALLTKLETVDLSFNNLKGTLPKEIFTEWSNIGTLKLEGNQLSGSFPSEIGLWRSLHKLQWEDNLFAGSLPSELMELGGSLLNLELGNNRLEGTIPIKLGYSLTNLRELELHQNHFRSSIPSEIGLLSNALRELKLNNNEMTSTIPTDLGRLTALELLFLGYNKLNGTLPSQLGLLSSMTTFSVEHNDDLVGKIPREMIPLAAVTNHSLSSKDNPVLLDGEQGSLITVLLEGTGLTGMVPSQFCDIQTLDCTDTTLCGCHCPCN